MIPVTCNKLQGFFISIKIRWKDFNHILELYETAQYSVRKILLPNLYT